MDVPFWSLVPCITLDKQEREALTGRAFRQQRWLSDRRAEPAAGSLAGRRQRGRRFYAFYLYHGVLFILSTLVILRNVKERYSSSHSTQQVAHRLRDVLTLIYRNKPLFALLIMALSWNGPQHHYFVRHLLL